MPKKENLSCDIINSKHREHKMPRPRNRNRSPIKSYEHRDKSRLNNPPAGVAPTYEVGERQTTRYAYDPHLDPQLIWSGKAEHTSFEVNLVSLHIHERISTRAILDAVRRPEPVHPDLFGETPLRADQQIEFYRHEVGWANRLILGDSLLVMNSLLIKEGMAGKVQMIYIDPPYGIKYASNFQPRIDRRDVKDKDEDLTHEPEQIKAYRDTWKLGIHSYLTYLRDRLLLSRELLTESGSIFVQINDENLHLVRCLLDEVFGRENFVSVISFAKTSGFESKTLSRAGDYLLWYSKRIEEIKYRQLYWYKTEDTSGYSKTKEGHLYSSGALFSPGITEEGSKPFEFQGQRFTPSGGHWKTSEEGLKRLVEADRVEAAGKTLRYIRYLDDFKLVPMNNIWEDTQTFAEKMYAVQTNTKVIERCILMTTDPGDLVFDPTCGSGTTAWCAEKWGRRWITCDTSRVAVAIARQRLMTAKFDYYELKDPERGPAGGFVYETVPHITLESIAKNTEIDAIAAKFQPQIEEALAELNAALKSKPIRIRIAEGGRAGQVVDFSAPDTETVTLPSGQVVKANELLEWEVPREVPHPVWPDEAKQAYWRLLGLKNSLDPKEQEEAEGLLELIYKTTGHRWSLSEIPVPMPSDDWSEKAKEAFRRFWDFKRKKKQEIDESIKRNAPQEVLYDQPKKVRNVVRVSGPFTVEAIPVPAIEDPTQAPIPQFEVEEVRVRIKDRGGDYLTNMINLLKQQVGVLFPGRKKLELLNIRSLNLGYLHAEAEAKQNGNVLRVAISFGPQYGPVIAHQVQEAILTARMNGFNILVFAGFAFDPEAQALIQKAPVKGLQIHFANIAPDVLVGDLLKTTRASQIFTVFGQPDVRLEKQKDGTYRVELRGVDIYDPLTGEVHSTRGEDVAAWFLDTDYDGMTFHICQAFFPGDHDAWEKLQRALKAQIDAEAFDRMRGTVSFPFESGKHHRIAVKVIDFRGNEVVRVMNLHTGAPSYAHS
jgi:adenine-specific DNA-methyltransferase